MNFLNQMARVPLTCRFHDLDFTLQGTEFRPVVTLGRRNCVDGRKGWGLTRDGGAYRSDVLLDELKRAPAMLAATMQAAKIRNTSTLM